LVGIILFSNIINYTLDNYYVITMLFFVGLIVGGITSILKEVDRKDYIYTECSETAIQKGRPDCHATDS
ncbi:MAG: DUF368 domain-containing protein, partial [Bacteroidaceae bacterium]|nr:DUF368 domain-containing protein [Bacteroidaceae bacterium]